MAEVVQAAAGRARVAQGLRPVIPGYAVVGPAVTCACACDDNLALHRALHGAPPGAVVVAAADAASHRGHLGELMALDALSAGVAAILVDGPVRDLSAVAGLGLPVFHRGVGAAPCAKERAVSVGKRVVLGGVEVDPGDMVVADDDGIAVVSASDWPDIVRAVTALQQREDGIRARLAAGERLADVLGLAGEGAGAR